MNFNTIKYCGDQIIVDQQGNLYDLCCANACAKTTDLFVLRWTTGGYHLARRF